MSYQFIKTEAELDRWLAENEASCWFGLDTEFISEGRFHSELCLIQISTEDGLVLIDALALKDGLVPFWERICRKDAKVIVHACRSEMEFCHNAVGKFPEHVFDIQIAAGFVGCDYPSSFKALGEKILKIYLPKEESRSDWQRRPLSFLQVEYALNDVLYLKKMADALESKLEEYDRTDWFRQEMKNYLSSLQNSFLTENWTKLPKISNLTPRELAIAREICFWRDSEAERKNKPVCRILRDDLIVELARKKSGKPDRLQSVRGLHLNEKELSEVGQAAEKALALNERDLPQLEKINGSSQYPAICQFIMTVLTDFAKQHQIAVSLLTSTKDVRDFIADYYGKLSEEKQPRLKFGWRKEMIGDLLRDLLNGKMAIKLSGKELAIKLIPLDGRNEYSE